MKKLLTVVALSSALILTACGSSEGVATSVSPESTEEPVAVESDSQTESVEEDPAEVYYGTWESVGADVDGSYFSIEEIEATGDDSLSGLIFVIKEGGKAYLTQNDDSALTDWELIDTGIKVGQIELTYGEDGRISYEKNKVCIHLEKVSDSQSITDVVPADNSSSSASSETIEATESAEYVDGIRPEFQELMDSYTAFIDEYVEFMKVYNKTDNKTTELTDEYGEYIDKYFDLDDKINDIDDSELTADEALLYSETMLDAGEKIATIYD